MFTVRPSEIEGLRGNDGRAFAAFLNDLIRAHARSVGISDAAVHTDIQTIEDGGVDAEVNSSSIFDPSGWMSFPTTWQFKATDTRHVGAAALRKEIEKSFAKNRVKAGFAYRVCIADSLTAKMRHDRDTALEDAASRINREAPFPKVLDANDLAAWASSYPAIVLKHFRQSATGRVLTLGTWGTNIATNTQVYVESPPFVIAQSRLMSHLDFSTRPHDVVITLRGEAGVGKSRLVFEVVKSNGALASMVMYTEAEHSVIDLAYQLAEQQVNAILICDECSSDTIYRLREILKGHVNRVRVIAIETTRGSYQPGTDPNAIELEAISEPTLNEILATNFPEVSSEHRRAYTYLSEGFVRFAVELCLQDKVTGSLHLTERTSFIREYLHRYLTDEERKVVEAIGLVDAVGFRGGAVEELNFLCSLTGVDASQIKDAVHRVSAAPGFVATAGRYWHVTPRIVAQVAFSNAWRRWANDDSERFLNCLAANSAFLPLFLRRVAESASDEVRATVSNFMAKRLGNLESSRLTDPAFVELLADLVEVSPIDYLPRLRNLLELTASVPTPSTKANNFRLVDVWNHLLRNIRRLAMIKDYFHDIEAIVFKLATVEIKPTSGNDATKLYQQLFNIQLSGTTLPVEDRLPVLFSRLRSTELEEVRLAVNTVVNMFDPHPSRGVDAPMVSGHISDDEWQPQTWQEQRICLDLVVNEIRSVIENGSAMARDLVWDASLEHLDNFIYSGYESALVELFPAELVPEHVRIRVVAEAAARIQEWEYHNEIDSEARHPRIVREIAVFRSLKANLARNDLHARLADFIGVDHWRVGAFDRRSSWPSKLDALARESFQDTSLLINEMDWLCTYDCYNACAFGESLAKQDTNGILLNTVLAKAKTVQVPSIVLGYIKGLMGSEINFADRVNQFLDQLENDYPLSAYFLAVNGGENLYCLQRALRLLDSRKVTAAHFWVFERGVGERKLNDGEFHAVLSRLVAAAGRGEEGAARVGVRFVERRLSELTQDQELASPFDEQIARRLAWDLLELDNSGNAFQDSGDWERVLTALAPIDHKRGARLAARALATPRRGMEQCLSTILCEIAAHDPDLVMTEVGQVMLEKSTRFVFDFHPHHEIFAALPLNVVMGWLWKMGKRGADAIAKHLPRPYIDSNGTPTVPKLTALVLEEFGTDSLVFGSFCLGSFAWIEAEELGEAVTRRKALADVASKFLTRPEPWLRDWADFAHQEALGQELYMSQHDDEMAEWRFRRQS